MSFQPYPIEADRRLERRVGQELASLHYPSLRHVKVSARGSTVTLSGRVGSFHEKELAQHSSSRLPGVSHVVDFLRVADRDDSAPTSDENSPRRPEAVSIRPATQEIAERRLDYRLQVRVVAALSFAPAFQRITVTVTDKIARLEGMVATQVLKDEAGELTRRVATIAGVDNQIVVDAEALAEAKRVHQAATARQTADQRARRRGIALTAAVVLLGLGWHYGWSQAETPTENRPPVVAIRGHLTVDGVPPAGAMVVFHRQDPPSIAHPTPMGIVGPDGTYQLTTFAANDGAPAGQYTVTIFWKPGTEEGATAPPGLPERYATVKSSPLTATITETTERVPLQATRR